LSRYVGISNAGAADDFSDKLRAARSTMNKLAQEARRLSVAGVDAALESPFGRRFAPAVRAWRTDLKTGILVSRIGFVMLFALSWISGVVVYQWAGFGAALAAGAVVLLSAVIGGFLSAPGTIDPLGGTAEREHFEDH
jgi:hypothetical protein